MIFLLERFRALRCATLSHDEVVTVKQLRGHRAMRSVSDDYTSLSFVIRTSKVEPRSAKSSGKIDSATKTDYFVSMMGFEKALLYSAVSDGEHSISWISKLGGCNLKDSLSRASQGVVNILGSVILMDISKWTASTRR